MAIQFQQQVQSSKHQQDNIHGWSCNQRAKIETCNVSDRPLTLWNLPSSLPCRISKGSEACHLHNRVQPNVGDAISSETSKTWHGMCEQCWSRTGLELLVNANKSSFARNDTPPSLRQCKRGLVALPSSLSATMVSCTVAKAKEVCHFLTQWKWHLRQCLSFRVRTL